MCLWNLYLTGGGVIWCSSFMKQESTSTTNVQCMHQSINLFTHCTSVQLWKTLAGVLLLFKFSLGFVFDLTVELVYWSIRLRTIAKKPRNSNLVWTASHKVYTIDLSGITAVVCAHKIAILQVYTQFFCYSASYMPYFLCEISAARLKVSLPNIVREKYWQNY